MEYIQGTLTITVTQPNNTIHPETFTKELDNLESIDIFVLRQHTRMIIYKHNIKIPNIKSVTFTPRPITVTL